MSKKKCNAALRYLDTVTTITFFYSIPQNYLTENPDWVGHKNQTVFILFFETQNGSKVKVRYQVGKEGFQDSISFTFSVPNVVQGNNVKIIPSGTDIVEIIQNDVYHAFAMEMNLPEPSFLRAVFGRIDISFPFIVDKSQLLLYLDIARSTIISAYYDRGAYFNNDFQKRCARDVNGVTHYLSSKAHLISFYDKRMEADLDITEEILRLEDSTTGFDAIRRKVIQGQSQQHLRVDELDPQMCIKVIKRDLNWLTLDKHRFNKVRKPTIIENLGNMRQVIAINEVVNLMKEHPGISPSDIREHFNITRACLNGYLKCIKENDLLVPKFEDRYLPALMIDENGMQVDEKRIVSTFDYDIELHSTELPRMQIISQDGIVLKNLDLGLKEVPTMLPSAIEKAITSEPLIDTCDPVFRDENHQDLSCGDHNAVDGELNQELKMPTDKGSQESMAEIGSADYKNDAICRNEIVDNPSLSKHSQSGVPKETIDFSSLRHGRISRKTCYTLQSKRMKRIKNGNKFYRHPWGNDSPHSTRVESGHNFDP